MLCINKLSIKELLIMPSSRIDKIGQNGNDGLHYEELQMRFDDYQMHAHQFAVYEDSSYPYMGLAEEAGELIGKMAKIKRGDKQSDYAGLFKECGDVLWMLNEICVQNGFSLSAVAAANLEKLEDRKKRDQLKGTGDNR